MSENVFMIVNHLVNNPTYRPLLSLIKGIRNGIVLVYYLVSLPFLIYPSKENKKFQIILARSSYFLTHSFNI